MTHQDKVRVGDRYTHDDLRITVSAVKDGFAVINVLQTGSGTKWTKTQTLPFPGGFIKVFSAQPEKCEFCFIEPPAPGMAYCDDCLDSIPEIPAMTGS